MFWVFPTVFLDTGFVPFYGTPFVLLSVRFCYFKHDPHIAVFIFLLGTSSMLVFRNKIFSSVFFLIHSPLISSLTGPNIFRNIFLSNNTNFLTSNFLSGHISAPYRTTGRIKVMYNCFFNSLESRQ